MHHVPYKHVLHSGKTVIQYIYDSHYEGAAEAQDFVDEWAALHGSIDEERYQAVLHKLQYQAGHAIVWRDAICNWFYRESKIPDAQDRVGHYPGRTEAESMSLDGYTEVAVSPWETASGGKATVCAKPRCTATMRFGGNAGWYDLSVESFDQNNGSSQFELLVNGQRLRRWTADELLPTFKPDGHSSTRQTVSAVALRPGDEVRIVGVPNAKSRRLWIMWRSYRCAEAYMLKI